MKISVIMPVYNAYSYLNESINSILQQSYSDFEFIIINDGSTDKSEQIIRDFMKLDNRIKLINQKNLGITEALINGIDVSKTEIIARMDADDYSFPERLELQINEITNGFDFCCCRTLWKNTGRKSNFFYSFLPPKLLIKYTNPFIHGTYMFKKSMYYSLGGYDRSHKFSQDFFFMKKLIKNNFKIKYLNKILYKSRILDDSISSLNKNTQKKLAQKYRKL
tara:strand:+ start:9033 stop:9695 length:663 start_codon:yes stop_codon:yes gene_type:complete